MNKQASDEKNCAMWIDQRVDGSLWRFYYQQVEGHWQRYSRVKLVECH